MRRGKFLLGFTIAVFTFFGLKAMERNRYLHYKNGNYKCESFFQDKQSDQNKTK